VCRLLQRMAARGETTCTPVPPSPSPVRRPVLDLRSGYIRRGADQIPMQGSSGPWRNHQNWFRDLLRYRFGRLDDGVLRFARP
jgi:monooxygenase